jgi:hypothetical protein
MHRPTASAPQPLPQCHCDIRTVRQGLVAVKARRWCNKNAGLLCSLQPQAPAMLWHNPCTCGGFARSTTIPRLHPRKTRQTDKHQSATCDMCSRLHPRTHTCTHAQMDRNTDVSVRARTCTHPVQRRYTCTHTDTHTHTHTHTMYVTNRQQLRQRAAIKEAGLH